MPSTCFYAPTRTHHVVVVGLKNCQVHALNELLRNHPIVVCDKSPEALLRVRRLDCPVFLTRFVGHKHSQHAKQITSQEVICVTHGAARAVADVILSFFDLDEDLF
jgi:hypothetical protein